MLLYLPPDYYLRQFVQFSGFFSRTYSGMEDLTTIYFTHSGEVCTRNVHITVSSSAATVFHEQKSSIHSRDYIKNK